MMIDEIDLLEPVPMVQDDDLDVDVSGIGDWFWELLVEQQEG